ncbi:energy transducer TonB [Planctobacterium marinum]|uniref:energy transducer TonB n=1 Tax=Planctobacterium marinum TaxID=1631968 RepID=UPI001E40B834|nr:TonB family protein [Planctobacterium marinum]MCC2606984.1 energy transducer TonB [Planctobacterium marinum]
MLNPLLKYSGSLLAALVVTMALFLFMQRLVNQPLPALPDIQFSGMVALFQIQEQEQPPDSEPPPPPQQNTEPQMAETALNLSPATDSSLPISEDFLPGPVTPGLKFGLGSASEAIQTAGELLSQFGEDTREGFIEITPFATRRPNIPELAWRHQLNGWVLVAFNVSPQGQTRHIRVLDAHPKGVFEAEVIRAIKLWRYDVSDIVKDGQDVVLTQKIALQWQHYPQNSPYPE